MFGAFIIFRGEDHTRLRVTGTRMLLLSKFGLNENKTLLLLYSLLALKVMQRKGMIVKSCVLSCDGNRTI